MQTLLVIEDDRDLVRILKGYLEQAGYRVLAAYDGRLGLQMALEEAPDLVILDLMLPGMDGFEICRELRRRSEVPILMLTARVEETDRVLGLELGADDYVTKPFSPREVVARVRAILRRAQRPPQAPKVLRQGELELDPEGHVARLKGEELDLTPTEFRLLQTLMEAPGRAFSREQLLEALGEPWNDPRTVDSHIRNLRRKLGEDPSRPRYIETVYGVGYRFREAGP